MRKIWVVLLGILGLSLVAAGSGGGRAATAWSPMRKPVLQISQDDRILGNRDAPITIVEYASLGMSALRSFRERCPSRDQEGVDRHRESQAGAARLSRSTNRRCAPR